MSKLINMTRQQKLIFKVLIIIHLALVILTLSGRLNAFFNDASLRKGKAADFFAVYQSGNNLINDKSLYLDTEGASTPYSFPYRYLPFLGYTIGIISNILPPFQAYYLHIIICELFLFINIYITYQISKNYKIFILSTIPWLIFSPFLIEVFMGQWSFLLASFLFYTIYALLKRKKYLIYAYIVAPLIKPNALIITPLLLKLKKYKLLIITTISMIFTSLLYFFSYRNDLNRFIDNFKDSWYSHGGNLGFKSLYYIIFIRCLNVPYPRIWYYCFILALLMITLYLTIKCKRIILIFTIWICFYFFIYKDVWEHHYVLLMPVFSVIATNFNLNFARMLKKSHIILLISFLLIALPTIFITQYLFNSESPIEPDNYNIIFVMLYHIQKILGITFLYIWVSFRILKEK